MPMLLPLIWNVMSNPIAIMVIIAISSFGYGHHRASVKCNERIATEHARALQLHVIEQARQAKAAEAIAFADTNRAVEASKAGEAMQAEIEKLKADLQKKGSGHAKGVVCVIDSDFIRRVQRHDRSGGR